MPAEKKMQMHELTNKGMQLFSQARKIDQRQNLIILKITLHIFVYIDIYIHIKSTKKKKAIYFLGKGSHNFFL